MATIFELKEGIAALKAHQDPDGLYQYVIDQKSFELFQQVGQSPVLAHGFDQAASNDVVLPLPSKRPTSVGRSRHSLFAHNDARKPKQDQPEPPTPSNGPKSA